jgi:hypothetical protein
MERAEPWRINFKFSPDLELQSMYSDFGEAIQGAEDLEGMWLMTASYQEGRELEDVFIYKFKKLSPVNELLDGLIASMLESYGVSEPKIASIKVNGIDGYVGEGYATTCRRTARMATIP